MPRLSAGAFFGYLIMQLTFHRANYTGYWVEHSPRSGSLRIFFDEEEVTHLHDVAEKAAEIVFTDYARPDTDEIAERIYSDLTNKGIAYQISLRKVMADHEVIQDDINSIRQKLRSLLDRDGHDTSEIDEDMRRG